MYYLIVMGAGALLCSLLYGLRVKNLRTGLLTLPLMLVLGAVMAKLLYVLPMLPQQWSRYGLGCLVHIDAEEFSLWGGVAGVCLAVALTAGTAKKNPGQALDAFAPCGALLLAIARGAEYFLGTVYLHHGVIGLGNWIEDGSWNCFFPLAVQDEWGMWYGAVFMLEAAIALAAALLSVTLFRRKQTFTRTLFFLLAAQVFTEMLHSQSIAWGFVRVEQLYCAVAMLILLFLHCRHAVVTKGAFTPCVGYLVGVAIIIYLEFELDKSWISGLLESTGTDLGYTLATWDATFCYIVLFLVVVSMLLMERKAIRNRT